MLYNTHHMMKQRCNNKNAKSYEYYGGRGIKVCDEWKKYKNFEIWAFNNGYEDGLTLDRIDPNGDYEPSNCRWATRKEQAANRRTTIYFTIDGETKTMYEWCEIYHKKPNTVYVRMKTFGWDIKKALETPLQPKGRRKKFS